MNKDALNPTRNIFNFFGSVANDPSFIRKPETYLESYDFVYELHKVMFFAFNNIVKSAGGNHELSVIDIDNFLNKYPSFYKIWQTYNGVEYLNDAINNANAGLLQHDYDTIKKYSVLRKYVDAGIDISELYDYQSGDVKVLNEGVENIESMETSEIVDFFSSKILKIRKDWQDSNTENTSFKAGDDIDTLIDRLKESPDVGYPFMNDYYNSLFGGMRASKFMLRTTDTGGGKTRSAIRDICHVAFDEIYMTGYGWKKIGPTDPCLFISTELDQTELQLLMLAYITDIGTQDISRCQFTVEEEERLRRGSEVIKRSNLYFEYIEDFSSDDIEVIIDQYVLDHDVKYINFDYIQATPRLMSHAKDSYGSGLREDQALVNLSKDLKHMATKYQVFIMSSTQVNAKFSDDNPEESRTYQTLRGGKSIADKIDFGIVTSPVTKHDRQMLRNLIENSPYTMPDYAHWIYKNRGGEKGVVIWTSFDLGTLRETPLFVTDYNYNEHELNKLDIQISEDENSIEF